MVDKSLVAFIAALIVIILLVAYVVGNNMQSSVYDLGFEDGEKSVFSDAWEHGRVSNGSLDNNNTMILLGYDFEEVCIKQCNTWIEEARNQAAQNQANSG